jgi:FAD/FMN-containing dehydrogenase
VSIITPETEDDIRAVLEYASKNGLQVFPAGGGHGSFVPITSKTLYLDLKKFNKVHVDKQAATVTLGGGAITKQLIQECTDHGFYTTWVNSQAVGVVGSILGGGNVSLLTIKSTGR